MELNIKFNEKILVETANRVLDEYEYNGKTIREWADLIANPKTNADRIRSMTDEELAGFFEGYVDCVYCPRQLDNERCMNDDGSCFHTWLSWLKKEASE